MPDGRSIFRLLALAGFLLTVALALWLAEARPLVVIVVLALALAVAWAVEWRSWRRELSRPAAQKPSPSEPPAPPPKPAAPAPDPVPDPPPERPPLRPVPPPAPEPAPPPPPPEPTPPAARGGVVDLGTRATAAPRRWNLWDLERRAREEQHRDPEKYQEWSYLFVHLRQFASSDGFLPTEFDGLVRESFGELLEHAG